MSLAKNILKEVGVRMGNIGKAIHHQDNLDKTTPFKEVIEEGKKREPAEAGDTITKTTTQTSITAPKAPEAPKVQPVK